MAVFGLGSERDLMGGLRVAGQVHGDGGAWVSMALLSALFACSRALRQPLLGRGEGDLGYEAQPVNVGVECAS